MRRRAKSTMRSVGMAHFRMNVGRLQEGEHGKNQYQEQCRANPRSTLLELT